MFYNNGSAVGLSRGDFAGLNEDARASGGRAGIAGGCGGRFGWGLAALFDAGGATG